MYAWLTYVFSASNRHMIVVHSNPMEAVHIIMSTTNLTYINQSNILPLENNTDHKIKLIYGLIDNVVLSSLSIPHPTLIENVSIPGDQRWYIITDTFPSVSNSWDIQSFPTNLWDIYIVPDTPRQYSLPKFVPQSDNPIIPGPPPPDTVSPPLLVSQLNPEAAALVVKKLPYTWWYEWDMGALFNGNRLDVSNDQLLPKWYRGARINKNARPSPMNPISSTAALKWDRYIVFYWLSEVLSPSNKHCFIIVNSNYNYLFREVVATFLGEEIKGTGILLTDNIPYIVKDPLSIYRHYIVVTSNDFNQMIFVDTNAWKLVFIDGNTMSNSPSWFNIPMYQPPTLVY